MSFDTLIRGGILVTPDGARPGQLALSGGRIAAILAPDDGAEAGAVFDAFPLAEGAERQARDLDLELGLPDQRLPHRETEEGHLALHHLGHRGREPIKDRD